MEKTPINYEEKIMSQTDLVKKLAEAYKAAPSDEKKQQLRQELEKLRHYSNAVKGNPKERSNKSYELARTAALNQAIEQ